MTRFIRAASAAAILTSGLCSLGCVTGGGKTHGDAYRNAVDPCYPERYNHAARQAVLAPFAQQVHNGHVAAPDDLHLPLRGRLRQAHAGREGEARLDRAGAPGWTRSYSSRPRPTSR